MMGWAAIHDTRIIECDDSVMRRCLSFYMLCFRAGRKARQKSH
jgi:hypothetical protein